MAANLRHFGVQHCGAELGACFHVHLLRPLQVSRLARCATQHPSHLLWNNSGKVLQAAEAEARQYAPLKATRAAC